MNKNISSASPYISAQDAARASGLTRDYISRLCRAGTLRARREGKQWFVNEQSLNAFLILNEYAHTKKRELLKNQRMSEYHNSAQPDLTHTWGTNVEDLLTRSVEVDDPDKKPISSALENLLKVPAGASHAALQITHIPVYTISPFMEIVHRFVALICTVLVILGAYTLVNPDGSLLLVRKTIAMSSFVENRSMAALRSIIPVSISEAASGAAAFEQLIN